MDEADADCSIGVAEYASVVGREYTSGFVSRGITIRELVLNARPSGVALCMGLGVGRCVFRGSRAEPLPLESSSESEVSGDGELVYTDSILRLRPRDSTGAVKSNEDGVLFGELADDPGRLRSERLRCAIFGVAGLMPEMLVLIVRVRMGRLALSGRSALERDFALCDFFRCTSDPVWMGGGRGGLCVDMDGVGGWELSGFKDSAIISMSLPMSEVKGDDPRDCEGTAPSSSLRLAGEIGGWGCVVL
jgi:hypothetical protein